MESPWRRLDDWKTELVLVARADVGNALIWEQKWILPEDRLKTRPALQAIARGAPLFRVRKNIAKILRDRGIPTHEFGFHRVSEGWYYARTGPRPCRAEGESHEPLSAVLEALGKADDEDVEPIRDEILDAIVRVVSNDVLTERALMIAEALPALGPDPATIDEADLDALEAAGERGLPSGAPPSILELVRAAVPAPSAVPTPARVEPLPPSSTEPTNSAPAQPRRGGPSTFTLFGISAVCFVMAIRIGARDPVMAAVIAAVGLVPLALAIHRLTRRH